MKEKKRGCGQNRAHASRKMNSEAKDQSASFLTQCRMVEKMLSVSAVECLLRHGVEDSDPS